MLKVTQYKAMALKSTLLYVVLVLHSPLSTGKSQKAKQSAPSVWQWRCQHEQVAHHERV